jgi:tetratricopeptide (TPR) repeat protein
LSRPSIFISYSHKDEKWKDLILDHLGIAQKQELYDLWDDRLIEGGEDWFDAITRAIDAGCVGILLISANSLTSNFILKEEVPKLIEKRDAGKLRLYPIIIKPCNWKSVEWLKKMNLRPVDGRPLGLTKNNEVTETQIDLDLTKIAEEIGGLMKKMATPAVPSQPLSTECVTATSYARIPTLPSPKPFVGREEHLNTIEKKLKSNGVIGLISLKGMPGVGKSALALESAYRFAHLFPDGRYWVDLRSGDATIAIRNLLRDLEISHLAGPDAGFEEMCGVVRSELINRRVLIILDNAETIDQPRLERLADLCATTIVTSRVSLDPTTDILVDKLEDEDALALLRRLGINIDDEREDALKLIARLGGLALALEITAKRMATYTPRQSCADALAELHDSRHLVEAIMIPRRDTREGNIAEAFALSYRKLDDDLKSAFHALGLCAELGAPLEAVARMLDIEQDAARNLLLALAERSLTNFSGRRAVLHPLLHSYAGMCIHKMPEHMAEMIKQHVLYFGGEIGGAYQRAVNDDEGEAQILALAHADREIENVLLAQVRALEDGFPDAAMALEVLGNLRLYWQRRYAPQLYTWLMKTRILARQAGQKIQEANTLQAIGYVLSFRDNNDAALDSYDEALTLYKLVGSKLGEANALKAIGDVLYFRKEMDAALASYDEALTLYKLVGDKFGQANALRAIGDVLYFRKEMDAALASYDEALILFKLVGSKLGQANALKAIGDVFSFRKEMDAALASYDEALTLYKLIGDKLGQANVRLSKGEMTDDPEEYEEAIRLYEQIDARYGIAKSKVNYALMLIGSGDLERGLKLFMEAREECVAIKFESGIQAIDKLLAKAEQSEGSE